MSNRVTEFEPKTALPRTHAHVKDDVTCNANPDIGGSHELGKANVERLVCTHARVIGNPVQPGEVGWDELPGIFGFDEFREHQANSIRSLAYGMDTLVVAPTGGGKSEIFFAAGLLRGGLTMVVYPLLALIQDQAERLEALGIPYRIWNSTVNDSHKAETLQMIDEGEAFFLLTTPESLKGKKLSRTLMGMVNLAAVDECHCCLRDGSYRPNYAKLGEILDGIRPQVRLACTATLPGDDEDKLIAEIRMNQPIRERLPVARGNLRIVTDFRDKAVLCEILRRHDGEPGILYVATVRLANGMGEVLQRQGWNVGIYHGELSDKDKRNSQASFMEGKIPIMVATDAFGMGVNKSDIRWIAHYDPPASIEAWVQGFGRAGRDGKPSRVYGLFKGDDQGWTTRRFLVESSHPPVDTVRQVWVFLTSAPSHALTRKQIGEYALGRSRRGLGEGAISALMRHRLAVCDPNPDDRRKRLYRACGDFGKADWHEYEAQRHDSFSRLDQFQQLVSQRDSQIPASIDSYFDGVNP